MQTIAKNSPVSLDVVYLASAEHFSINVNQVVSCSDTPFNTLQRNIDYATYFSLYQKHGLLELSASAICRQRLEEVSGFNPDFRGAEDFEMIMRAVYGRMGYAVADPPNLNLFTLLIHATR
jgi:hypothetical protein